MCAIIGVRCIPTEENFNRIESLFVQSKIRGLHATGISYVVNNQLITKKEPIPADVFIKNFNIRKTFQNEEQITFIGHCRYSTSDILYNQPIADDNFSIVHNGVVTQKEAFEWKDLFKYDCTTKNDSELLFKYLKDNQDIKDFYNYFGNISFALLSLDLKGEISAYRNSLRPLWKVEKDNDTFYASTQNILIRSGFTSEDCVKLYSIDSKEKQNRSMHG